MREAPKNPRSKYPGHVAVIRFNQPIEGRELITEIPVLSNLHRYFAHDAIESEDQILLVDTHGEVLTMLPSSQVQSIEWEEFPHMPTFSVLRSAWRFNNWEHHQAPWTEDEITRLKLEVEDGLDVSSIAELHKRTWASIAGRILELCEVTWKVQNSNSDVVTPEDPEASEAQPEIEVELCRHEIRSSTCISCQKPRPGINQLVWTTEGGNAFHNQRACIWLLKGQERADNSGLQIHPIRATTPGDAKVDGYDPCRYCCP